MRRINIFKVKKLRKGFTLIELLIVVAIIGILSAVGALFYRGYVEDANLAMCHNKHNQVVDYISTELMRCSVGLEFSAYLKYGKSKVGEGCECGNTTNSGCGNRAIKFQHHFSAAIAGFPQHWIETNLSGPCAGSGAECGIGLIPNPFFKNKRSFAINWSIPGNELHPTYYKYDSKYKGSVDLLGITHCNVNDQNNTKTFHGKKYLADPNKAQCHTRCGPKINDYITSYIKNPY